MGFLASAFGLAIVVIGLLGVSGFAAIVRWWARQSAAFRRAWAGVACVVGGFLLWSVIV